MVTPVEVRVLGPVEVRGGARPLHRPFALDLVVYLALHPGGVPTDVWTEALWPERQRAPATLCSTASAARRALGSSTAGEDHLPRRRGRLQLGPGVTTDWQQLRGLSGRPEAVAWREALQLVRGRPFEGLRSPDWVVLEGTAALVAEAVVELAVRVAELELRAGNPAGAVAAARRGLPASPFDERLFRILLRAADAAGNRAGLDAVMAELWHRVADEGPPRSSRRGGGWGSGTWFPLPSARGTEPSDGVFHPETVALYRTLASRWSDHAPVPRRSRVATGGGCARQ